MKLLKVIFILSFLFAFTNICVAQKAKIAFVNAKSLYTSENELTRLTDSLKSVNPSFSNLNAEEKDKEFKRIAKSCSDAKNNIVENETVTFHAKENTVCVVIKDIADYVESFKKKHEFVLLIDIGSCDAISICSEGVDVTKQFVEEYNDARK